METIFITIALILGAIIGAILTIITASLLPDNDADEIIRLRNEEIELKKIIKLQKEALDKGDNNCQKSINQQINKIEDCYLEKIKEIEHKAYYTESNLRKYKDIYKFRKNLAKALLTDKALITYNSNKNNYKNETK